MTCDNFLCGSIHLAQMIFLIKRNFYERNEYVNQIQGLLQIHLFSERPRVRFPATPKVFSGKNQKKLKRAKEKETMEKTKNLFKEFNCV